MTDGLPRYNDVFEREAANEDTVTLGYDMVYCRDIGAWSYNAKQNGRVEIWGAVRDAGEVFNAMVALELDTHEVHSYTCSCSVHAGGRGMCAHAIALAVNYLAYTRIMSSIYVYVRPQRDAVSKAPQKRTRRASVRTSSQINDLVRAYANQTLERTTRQTSSSPVASPTQEPAELTCVIASADTTWRYSWSEDTWVLGLKVSRGKASYVVKDIGDLVDAWHTGSYFTYGKNLAFMHGRSAFSEQSNALLEMLSPLVDAQNSLYNAQESRNRSRSSYYYEDVPRVPSKTLPLSSAQLIAVLDLMQGSQVVVETRADEYSTKKKRRTVTVCEGNPAFVVNLAPGREGSYDLIVEPRDLECITDGTTLYLLGKSKVQRCDAEFVRDLGAFCQSLLPLSAKTRALHIRADDMPAFCAAVLPALRKHTHLSAPEQVEEFVPAAPEFGFRVGLDHGCVWCEATVRYGDQELGLFEPVYDDQPVRDVEHELAAQALVERYFMFDVPVMPDYGNPVRRPAKGSKKPAALPSWMAAASIRPKKAPQPTGPSHPWFYEDDDEAYYALLSEGLREFDAMGEVMLSERLSNRSIRQAPQVRVDASVRSGLLDIHVTADDMDASELAAYLASYRRKQRYVRLDGGDIVRLDGTVARVSDLADGLGIDAEELVNGATGLPANRTLFVDAMLKHAPGVRYERNRAFRRIVRDFETVADADYTPSEQLRDVLRPYQEEGFKWLCTLGAVGFGGILADEMGLGKTLQTIAYLEQARDAGEEKPAIVVCPASLVYNWRSEFERFAPSMDVVCVTGDKRRRREAIADAGEADVLVTSYDLMRRDVGDYEGTEFSCAILDEAQFVKNHNTQAAKAVRKLDARVRFALTGTPIENRLMELWSIFDFLMPGVLGTDADFSRRFANPIVGGDDETMERLRKLVGPFILRRLKRDVAQDLPDKNESVVLSQMQGEQDKLYRASASRLALMLADQTPAEFAGQRIKVLAELTKLRQICCDPHLLYENYKGNSAKLETCMELVHQAVDGGHAVLLFSQFTSMLQIIGEKLDAEKVRWFKLTGATSKEARARLVERFQAGEVPVFLISLKAGGTGLNLTAADIVIHYDPWWNLAAQNQATDRTHRIGQDKEVSVFKLIAKDTVEEKIVALQEAKQDLADSVLSGEAAGSASITRDDLLALLDQD